MSNTPFLKQQIAAAAVAGLMASSLRPAHAQDPLVGQSSLDLVVPRVQMSLEGPMATRLERIIRNWLVPAPEANPGMLEMMRLRDRKPPYEDPVPWAGEFVGKYLTSCVLACRLSSDKELRDVTARVVRELIQTQAADGYLGPFHDRHLCDRWDLWGHYHCMLALFYWHRDTGDSDALQTARRAADLMCATFLNTGKRVHDAGSHEMNMAVMHVLGLLYRETGQVNYLRLMREIERDWQKPPAGDYHRLAATGIEFYQTPKPRWESLHPMIGLAELFRITGEDSYRRALIHWWRSIYRTDIHNSGSFSTDEQAVGNPFRPGAIETCCTVAWLALSVEALRLTADSGIADALEHATWNAVLGYQHPSGRWCTYDTPMNGKRLASAHSIVFQSRPGTPELNCCSVNGPNGLGLISQWAVLAEAEGMYLNYYGPGKTEVQLENGSRWSFVQTTDYPATGNVELKVYPPQAAALPLLVRIPEWSRKTKIAVNGVPLENVRPGRYHRIARTWQPGDTIHLGFDLHPRALRGDQHVGFNSSLLRGPILLAFDQKHNTMDPIHAPELDLASLQLEPLPAEDPLLRDRVLGPVMAFAARSVDGQRVVLCDFASSGASGTYYRSWLPIRNAPPAPFQLQHPEANAVLPVEEVMFAWSRAEPGSAYELLIATDADFEDLRLHETSLEKPEFQWAPPSDARGTYHWQVTARHGELETGAVNGPSAFTIDPKVPTSLRGTVLKAALAGNPEPQEGRLLISSDVTPGPGRDGAEGGGLAFNGKSSKLVYDAPQFPLRTYTFAAWFCPRDLGIDGRRWHQIVSSWCAPMNDPLRVSVQDMELVVSIEQPGGGCRLSGGRIENGRWTHVAVIKKLTELALFIDGKKSATATVPASFQPGPRNVGIGCNPNFSGPEVFQGGLAEVVFVREALPEAAVRKLAAVP
ncbi:MAG: beta-L-arabinofuranosidase domain-containing protein [Verrucomicrobiia bacterium]